MDLWVRVTCHEVHKGDRRLVSAESAERVAFVVCAAALRLPRGGGSATRTPWAFASLGCWGWAPLSRSPSLRSAVGAGVRLGLHFARVLAGRSHLPLAQGYALVTPVATIRGMFTLEQVDEIHDRHGSAETLRAYLDALRGIRVERSVSFITDGHTEHHGKDGYMVATPPAHQVFLVADVSDHDGFLAALEEESYERTSQALAESGVERWVFDTHALTMTYYDKAGNELLKEDIE